MNNKLLQAYTALLALCLSATIHGRESLDIRVQGTNWGKGAIRDIEAVLQSTAKELWKNAEPEILQPILVTRSKQGPIVLFQRGPRGEYFVKLNTGERYWCQYAFQFAHEFGHILSRYKDGDTTNKWFEESICEVASLYALRAMAKSWKTGAPYPNWSGYSSHLQQYAKERIEQFKLPGDVHFGTWYAQNAVHLKTHPTDRRKNAAVAIELLPLFEENPGSWRAVHYLNESVWKEPQDFTTYLRNWHRHVPKELKPFVEKVSEKFGIRAAVQGKDTQVANSKS